MESFLDSVNYYLRYYHKSAIYAWEHITPMQYGWLLISVAVIGWLLMKSGLKR